jgi:A118 family predicted phage portal protein
MWIADMFRKVVNMLFPKSSLEKAIGRQIAVSEKMQEAISLWNDMYLDEPPWKGDTQTMNLPSSIAHEFARLVTLENEFTVTGSEMADFIDGELHRALKDFQNKVELYCAKGGMAMKPYVNGNMVEVDFTQADCFFPTDYDSNGNITGAIFVDTVRQGDYLFTRLETHQFIPDQTVTDEEGNVSQTNMYTVENKAYRSERLQYYHSDDSLNQSARDPFHEEVPLDAVDQWASLQPYVELHDVERPLFVYIRVPSANNVDTKSPLGASVYSRAVEAIQSTDEQYTQIKNEFKTFEAAIEAEQDLFKKTKDGKPILPSGKERAFRTYDTRTGDGNQPLLKEFNPAFRDSSLYNGLDHDLKHVEFLCELAYGTISDPASVDRTATEVITAKQRSYSAVCNMQKAWQEGLEHLVYAMSAYAALYGLAPFGPAELAISFGDGVLEDVDKEYQRRWAMVMAGKMRIEKFYEWYLGISEDEAKEWIPAAPAIPGIE